MASCTEGASCTDGTGHRTEGSHCAGIIRRVVPRTVHADGGNGPLTTAERTERQPPQRRGNLTLCWTGQSNRSSRIDRSIAESSRSLDQGGAAGPASAAGFALGGPPAARRAAYRAGPADQSGSLCPPVTACGRLPRRIGVPVTSTASKGGFDVAARLAFVPVARRG
jgi:hypothetical protein